MDWAKINETMCQLARRKDPKADGWARKIHYTDEYSECIVCGRSIHYTEYLAHALLDLKNYNLLVFL